jgi:hypothetical protein
MVFGSDSLAPGEPAQRWLSEWTIYLFLRGECLTDVIPAKAGIHGALEDQNGSRLSPG